MRNKSTNVSNQQPAAKNIPSTNNNNNSNNTSNTASMNRSGNGVRKEVKLPKVPTTGNSSVSNTSMKAIWEGGGVKKSTENGSKE